MSRKYQGSRGSYQAPKPPMPQVPSKNTNKKVGFEYNMFTKKELVEFLNENDENYMSIEKPYMRLLRKREENIGVKIDKLLSDNQDSIEALSNKNISTSKKLEIRIKLAESHEKYQKYNKELDSISDLMYKER